MKASILLPLLAGTFIFSLFPILSARFFSPTLQDALKFNLYFLPIGFIGNVALTWAFIKGATELGNTTLLVGLQVGITSVLVLMFSILILNQKVGWHSAIGVMLITAGIILLNRN